MIDTAKEKSNDLGLINNSITKGDGNIAGFLGEEIANQILDGQIDNTYEYDIITDRDGNRTTWDVKTKRCTSPPRNYYDCSVAGFNTKQKCDNYIFVRIEHNNGVFKNAWVLGWMEKNEYFKKSKLLKKGEIDKSNNFTVKADCYNLQIKYLNKFKVTK